MKILARAIGCLALVPVLTSFSVSIALGQDASTESSRRKPDRAGPQTAQDGSPVDSATVLGDLDFAASAERKIPSTTAQVPVSGGVVVHLENSQVLIDPNSFLVGESTQERSEPQGWIDPRNFLSVEGGIQPDSSANLIDGSYGVISDNNAESIEPEADSTALAPEEALVETVEESGEVSFVLADMSNTPQADLSLGVGYEEPIKLLDPRSFLAREGLIHAASQPGDDPFFGAPMFQDESIFLNPLPKNATEQQQREYDRDLERIAHSRDILQRPLLAAPLQDALKYVNDDAQPIEKLPPPDVQYLASFPAYSMEPIHYNLFRSGPHGQWHTKFACWKSPNFFHQPLYFEEQNLERYGGHRGCIQPFASAAHFFGSTALLPYNMGADLPCSRVYTAGLCRPGDGVRFYRNGLGRSGRGLTLQTLLVAGIVFAIP